uniref:NtCtMGAM_N domain-containing protein n=1 Tax=Macrostomum lignano TaxID=282301 RepID=A0A1I8HXG7_9PLAT
MKPRLNVVLVASAGLLLAAASICVQRAGAVKTNCFPELKQNEDPGRERCEQRKCEYEGQQSDNSPSCLWTRSGYIVSSVAENTNTQYSAVVTRQQDYNGPFPGSRDLDELRFSVKAISDNGLRITISDLGGVRYQVPKEALNIPEPGPTNPDATVYRWEANTSSSLLDVYQKTHPDQAIMSLLKTGFVFSDQFIQLSLGLDCQNIVGFGEHNHERLVHDRRYKRWSIFTRDAVRGISTAPIHPYFVCTDAGKHMSVLLKNSNAIEVELTPDGIVYRVLGGILDFYVFMASSPESLAQTYSAAIGHPLMPPYWSLGFQLCRWGYRNITEVQNVIARNRAIGLPYDAQYGDIDYMQNTMDFTIDATNYPGLSSMVDDLHSHGQKYFVILDPAISSDEEMHKQVLPSQRYEPYHDGLARGVYVKNLDDTVHEGEVWPGRTVFPDYTLSATQAWWERWVSDFYYNQSIRVDGLWIDMNEPASFTYEPHKPQNFCPNNTWNYPPYIPTSFIGDRFYEKTICMETKHNWGRHYDVHSLYGHSMGMQSYQTLRNLFPEKRPIVFSRSTFVGSGRYAQHWLGDNHSRWPDLHWSIITMLEFNLFGFPYNGADICGFVYDATREMCIRWTQLGAFYPFSRNHNIKEADGVRTRDQDPASWDAEAQKIMKDALFFRYKYLPYLYTLFHYAHTNGATVVRSLAHEFPNDTAAVRIDEQFLWGSAMLISPVLSPAKLSIQAYLPPEDGWYDAYTGEEVQETGFVMLDAPLEHINVHIRKGFILPWQTPSTTTVSSRQNGLGLLVAAKQLPSSNLKATGSLFWDDGESFETYTAKKFILHEFELSTDETSGNHVLVIRTPFNGYKDPNSLKFENITILGFDTSKDWSVSVNSEQHSGIRVNPNRKTLILDSLSLPLGQSHSITFAVRSAGTAVASVIAVAICALLSTAVTGNNRWSLAILN